MKVFLPCLALLLSLDNPAQNPVFTHLFTADPAALVAGDSIYIYTGHDEAGVGGGGYVMNDWHVFSSGDMVHWTDHGEVLKISDFSWASANAWASHTIERNGKYYWYVTVSPDESVGGAFAIGVAVSDHPAGPYTDAIGTALITDDMTPDLTYDIDPAVFIDGDGLAYLYWGNGGICKVVKLKENMIELDGEIADISPPHFTEAAYMHKREGIYYLTYAANWPETIEYATAEGPVGPFTHRGTLNARVSSTTNHQSIVEFRDQWYFIYHTGDLPEGGDFRRSVAIEHLFYREDGSIAEVVQTPYGVAHTDSTAICLPAGIEPLYSVNSSGFGTARHITLQEGDRIVLQPDAGEEGSWQWELEGTELSLDSILSIEYIQVEQSGTYLTVFTSACGTRSFTSYDLEVRYALPEEIVSGSSYTIECVASGKVITVSNMATANGTNVVELDDQGLASQRYILTLVEDIFWKINPQHVTSRALDVYNISQDNGANIVIWDYWGGHGQQWQFAETDDGIFQVISRNSGKCLHVNLANHNVIQWDCNGQDNQQFRLIPASTSAIPESAGSLRVFPNPAPSGLVTIAPGPGETIRSLVVTDSKGRMVSWIDQPENQGIREHLALPSGIYFILIRTEASARVQKLIIE